MGITGLNLLYSGFLLISPSVRNLLLRTRTAQHSGAMSALDDITRHLEMGDWKVFHILGVNMEPLVFGELIMEFADQLKDANHNISHQDRDNHKITQI